MEFSDFREIGYRKRNTCVICGKGYDQPSINLPRFPLTEIYVDRRVDDYLGFVDQEFHICERCGHGQLANIVDQKILYGSCYKTRTSTSPSAQLAVETFLDFINNVLKNRTISTILEVGCNDLYVLGRFKDRAKVLYGVDPILKEMENSYKDDKIRIIGDFVENLDLTNLGCKIDVTIASHTLEHIEDPKRVVNSLLDISSNDAVCFFQFPGLETLINDAHFDQIFHQHLNYFSLQSVLCLLDEVGAELLDYKINPYHWGTLMIAFRKKKLGSTLNRSFRDGAQKISRRFVNRQYKVFQQNIDLTRKRVDLFSNRKMYGYGAALMLPVLEYYLNRLSHLRYIIDEDESKKDLFYLNLPVQIKMLSEINDIKDSIVLVTAINSMWAARAIISKLIKLNVEKIIIPSNLI